jgi:hypothetical protein
VTSPGCIDPENYDTMSCPLPDRFVNISLLMSSAFIVLMGVCRLGQVRKAPHRPRDSASFSCLYLYPHKNARANLHLSGQPNTVLARAVHLAGPELRYLRLHERNRRPGAKDIDCKSITSHARLDKSRLALNPAYSRHPRSDLVEGADQGAHLLLFQQFINKLSRLETAC